MQTDPALYAPIIFATIIGFAALAALLLVPVSRFITREMRRGERWNEELRAGGHLRPPGEPGELDPNDVPPTPPPAR